MLVPPLSFPLRCPFSPLYFLHLKGLLSEITSPLTLSTQHSVAIFLTNSSFYILCLDNPMKYKHFVQSGRGGEGGACMCDIGGKGC